MEPVYNLQKRKVKESPPVPIKTYQWEDIRREKNRGKYPYTYLYKESYIESAEMEDEKENKENKPAPEGEKKVRKVRKVKKKVGEASKKDSIEKTEPTKEEDSKKEVLVEQLFTEETEITEIKLKEQPETPEPKPVDVSEKMEIEEIPSEKMEPPDQTEEKLSKEEVPTKNLTISTEFRDLSAERTIEGQDIETIPPESEKLILEEAENKIEEQKDVTDKMSVDVSIGVVSKSTESEDTYTESNIEQYLDKEEVSKSVSDASCLEATTSMSDVELPIDTKPTLEVQDKKRKHSDLSEVTKSNLSLFEKMKNTKFKAPTFKIPKFKKLTFTKKNSKRVKAEPVQKTVAKVEIETSKGVSESPVYIYIPLNPSAEELEEERQAKLKLEGSRRVTSTSDPTNGNGHFNDTKDTNGTATSTTVEVKSVTSKWKSLQSKTDKKSPPFKKKSTKKTSPKSEKKSVSPVVPQNDAPVEYIHIPLTGPLPPELLEKETPKQEMGPSSKKESPKGSPKGAIKKKPAPKDKKSKDSDYKLAKDIKKLASKLKGIQKKNKKILGSKISSVKSPVKDETKPKKSSPTSKKRGDSPVQYIHIPLKGPLPENLEVSASKSDEEPVKDESEEIKTVEKTEEIESVPEKVPTEKKTEIEPIKDEETKTETEEVKIEEIKEIKKDEIKNEVVKKEEIEIPDKVESVVTENTLDKTEKEGTDKTDDSEKDKETKPAETSSQEKTEDQVEPSSKIPSTPSTPSSPTRDIDAILRMTGSSLSIENQKFIKIEKEVKKESLLTRMKSLKKPDKKLPAVKKRDIKSLEKESTKPPPSPKKDSLKVVYPGMRHKDSIVEYIHIPLKPTEDEVTQMEEDKDTEEMEVDDIKSSEKMETEETLPKPDESTEEKQKTTSESDKTEDKAEIMDAKSDNKKQDSGKGSVLSKLKGLTHKADKKPEIAEKPKISKESLEMKKKQIESKKHDESPSVEYIHIPLKSLETDESVKMDESEEVKQSEEVKKEPIIPMEISDSISDDIQKSSESELVVEKARQVEDTTVEQKTEEPFNTEEISSPTIIPKTEPVKVEKSKQETVTTKTEQPKIEKETIKQVVTSKWRGLKVGLKVDQKSPPTKKKQTKKTSPKSEKKPTTSTERSMAPMPKMRREDSIVEYIHIPLNPTPEQLRTEQEREKLRNLSKKATDEETKKEKEKERLKRIRKTTALAAQKEKEKQIKDKDKQIEDTDKTLKEKDKLIEEKVKSIEEIDKQIEEKGKEIEEDIKQITESEKQKEQSEQQTSISIVQAPEPTSAEPPKEVTDISKGAIKKQPQLKSKVKDTTSKLTEDIKKFASKLKELQKKPKMPTFKTFKRGSKLGSKKASPPVSKKTVSSDPLRIRPRREDSPVEYIHIPLNPSAEQLRMEQEREKLRQQAKKPTAEEIKKEKEKQRLRRISKAPAVTVSKTTVVTKKSKPEKPKKKPAPKSPSAPSTSPFNSLKKTKELSKAKLKILKDTVQQTKEKMAEKMAAKPEVKKIETPKEKKVEVKTKKSRDSPDYVFIPLKGPEVDTKQEETLEKEPPSSGINEEVLTVEKEKESESIVEEKALPVEKESESIVDEKVLPIEKESEIIVEEKTLPEPEIDSKKDDEKVVPVSEPRTDIDEDETHHYEPISKEDEEDGLKTAVPITKDSKPSEESSLKSVLKAADSPKLHKKVSFKRKSAASDQEQGLDNANIDNDDVIYETIQIGEPETEKPEKPTRKKDSKPKSVDEQPKSPDREEDHEKWSKSTDHEYEPINPPAEPEAAADSPPPVHVTQLTDLTVEARASPEPQVDAAVELRQLRIPLDDELVVANAETPEPDSAADRTSSPDTQATYLGTPTTTLSSRTEGISTSQVDSAVLEHLPLKKEGRQKKLAEMEEAEPQGPNIQDRLKTQAGKLKTKFKSMKKPTFTIPNPKFSPKFRRPKFERPKFQRPKFERPKFQRPKFETPKFSMPSMPKMPDRPKINFPSFSMPRPGRQRPADDRHISTTESSADSRKNIFDFRTYPRLFDKKKKAAASPAEEPAPPPEPATVPRAAERKKGPVGARWVHRFTDIQFADEESKKPASYSDELHSKDRGDSLERRMEADLRYEQALAEADDEMREYQRENQDLSRHSPYNVEGQEYTERWRHGSFHRREELDQQRERHMAMESEQSNRDEHSSVASSGHRGVIEEIDSDQFFLREKGISQDNLQVGLYLSSEIRDAFRQPVNALSQMEREYDLDASDISLARPKRPKRKLLKKTKKVKKTPHASQEEIPYDQESVNTEPEEYQRDYNTFPLPRPRRIKRSKMLAKEESLETSQGEMPIDDEVNLNVENLKSQEDLQAEVSSESLPNILGYVEKDLDVSHEYNKYLNDDSLMYENEIMQNIEQPEIIINADQKYEIETKDIDKYLEHTGMVETPKPPTRRQKSLKSLNLSEHDSIMGEFNRDKMMQDILEHELNVYRMEHEYIIPEDGRPVAPQRTRSRSRTESQADDDRTSHGAESFLTESEEVCEAPCRQELRDSMGYAIIDKSQKYRDSPLPTTPRRRRSTRSNRSDRSPVDTKFFTVPRALNDATPVRPTRNYSTLNPDRPPRKKSELDLTAEEKENIDISQYIEIEDDDHSRDLQSGDVINKMKGRPLPAPPRPPRKTRDRSKEALRDITQQSNIISDTISEHEKTLDVSPASPMEPVEEIEVSTQTDPLPDDFCCEEFVEEPTDRIVAPTRRKRSIHRDSSIQSLERSRDSSIPRSYERPKTPLERAASPNAMVIERRVQTPVEDVTHASLIVRPVAEYPRDSFVSQRFGADITDILPDNIITSPVIPYLEPEEMTPEPELGESVTVRVSETLSSDSATLLPQSTLEEPLSTTRDISDISTATSVPLESDIFSEEEVPEIPEKPQRRKSQAHVAQKQEPTPQPQIIERIIERQVPVCVTPGPDTEVEVLRAQRLQVTELDVEKLNVSELQANKILVSEIDGVSLQISELTSKSGNLVLNGLEIPSGLIQEILDRLQSSSQPPQPPSSSTEQVATQTSIEEPEPEPNTKEFTELITEQVATQTSLEIPDELLHFTPPSTEQVATQTSIDIEEQEQEIIKIMPVVHEDHSEHHGNMEESIDAEEFEELMAMPLMHAEQLQPIGVSIAPQELARLSTASPTIVVDPPEPTSEEPEVEQEQEQEQEEEQDAIAHIRERIRFIEEEMNEFISEFTPDEMTEIKSEIESIIDIASERVRSKEDITEESENVERRPLSESPTEEMVVVRIPEYESPEEIVLIRENILREPTISEEHDREPVEIAFHHSDLPTDGVVIVRENFGGEAEPIELFVPYSQDDILELMPGLETDVMFLPQEISPREHTRVFEEEYMEPEHTHVTLAQIHTQTQQTETQIEPNLVMRDTQSNTQNTETRDSVVPKEFYELKSEQAEIIENIQKQHKKEVTSTPTETKTETTPTEETKREQAESSHSTSSQPITPPRPPPPSQDRFAEHVQPGQMFHELHYPLSYYPEYVASVPPPGFYTMRSPHTQDLSDEEVPVHHRRRRHHRHLSRSRSSSDDERRVSRRHAARSPEPSIPQLSGQLARACSTSVARVIRQLGSYLSSHLGTREGKHDMQIAVVILLVLIAGLILLGFGSEKTIHLHHWEYFNPPKEL